MFKKSSRDAHKTNDADVEDYWVIRRTRETILATILVPNKHNFNYSVTSYLPQLTPLQTSYQIPCIILKAKLYCLRTRTNTSTIRARRLRMPNEPII